MKDRLSLGKVNVVKRKDLMVALGSISQRNGKVDIVKVLLQNGANVNALIEKKSGTSPGSSRWAC